ncbi:MAG: CrcB family protein [Alphaproteobacteria bacterium]|nr:CrcB family protein [Alphaproteobacteria bacterium]MCW5740241.1 CrcB family protein [Alphaproteobacteria bacterium]
MTTEARIYFAVGLGAMIGSVARSLVSLGLLHLLGPGSGWGTLAANVVGSLLIGLYATLTEPDGRVFASPAKRQFVLAGFCGGFTTFSIFSLETLLLIERQAFALAAINIGGSVVLWLVAVWLGYRLGARLNRLKGSADDAIH